MRREIAVAEEIVIERGEMVGEEVSERWMKGWKRRRVEEWWNRLRF